MKKNLPFKLGAVALAFTSAAFADEASLYRADEVVVTAARLPQSLDNSLLDVSVITADDISRAGQQTLAELLQSRAGVEIATTGGLGQPTGIFMRGSNSSHTLVLVDGVRINSATTGAAAWENIPLGQIERIEILRGPASSLYGSEAIGGVIQVFTKEGSGAPRPYLKFGLGSYNTRTLNVGVSGQSGDLLFSLNAGHIDSGSFSATNASEPFGNFNPDRDPYRNTNASARLAYQVSADHEVGLAFMNSDANTHFDSGPATDDVNRQVLRVFSFYSRNQLTANWESLLRLGQSVDELSTIGVWPGSVRTDQTQLTWQNNLTTSAGVFTLGIENLDQDVTSDTVYSQTSRTIRSGFAAYNGRYGDHQFQANVREDDNSQFGNHETGSLAYGYRIAPAWRAAASIGTAFKAPTFNDLYAPAFWGSNPNLRPEKSRNKDLSLTYQGQAQKIKATYFDNHITDLIAGYPVVNINHARIEGTELAYQGMIGDARLYAEVTLQRPLDEDSGRRLQRRASKFARFGADRTFGAWKLGGELIASGDRFDSTTEAPASRMGGYGIVNLFAGRDLTKETSISIRWNNIADQRYELVQGYNTPGSNVFVSLLYQPR